METTRNFTLRPALPDKLHHQAPLLLRTFSCFKAIQLDLLKAISPFPLTPIPCHTPDPHPLTLGRLGLRLFWDFLTGVTLSASGGDEASNSVVLCRRIVQFRQNFHASIFASWSIAPARKRLI